MVTISMEPRSHSKDAKIVPYKASLRETTPPDPVTANISGETEVNLQWVWPCAAVRE